MRRYEGMFLFDSALAADWAAVDREIKRLMERIGANLLVSIKYDDRKLAYEIKRRKRGTYVLTYFEADPQRIGELEHDTHLSDMILRELILDGRSVSDARIAELRALPPDTPLSPMQSDSRRHGDDYYPRYPRRDRERGEHERPPERPRVAAPPQEAEAPEEGVGESIFDPDAVADSDPEARR